MRERGREGGGTDRRTDRETNREREGNKRGIIIISLLALTLNQCLKVCVCVRERGGGEGQIDGQTERDK